MSLYASVNRIEPLMPAGSYKTYGASMPVNTHWGSATCEDIDCIAFLNGWVTSLDLSTELGQRQYDFCSHDKTRSFTEERDGTSLVKLTYPPGTICFRAGEHKAPVGRPPIFTVRDGDWRGNPRGTTPRVHRSADDWVDDFAEHQSRLAAQIQRG